uniref:Uncharacterized protein n=1 Tax=Panagrolaimus davidi TaxID=227884 RepID=A0A914P1F1_9BILA
MEEKHGWNLWMLDSHHGELWENRFQITCKNPTVSKIAETPSGWAVFRDGYKPMWEDVKNCGRLTAKSFEAVELYEIVAAFFNLLANDSNVSGIIYTRSKNFGLWLNNSDDKIIGELKSKLSTICNREEDEIKWDNFKGGKKADLHLRGVIWKYGQLSFKTETLTNLSVYDIDILEASPNFVINYKKEFPIKCDECFLVEAEFTSPFNTESIKKFVESCFFWFQKSKKSQIIGISKAIALKIVGKKITIRFYTDPIGFCKRKNAKYTNFHEVLIIFAQKWKSQLITEFLSPENNIKMIGLREKDRDLQFSI